MRTAITAFGEHLAEQDIGRAQGRRLAPRRASPAFPGVADDEVGGYHHMGTTRMAADPRRGVVDADCRVHGTSNLYVGGSSVFATTGHRNPTYTLVQLALRLGDHLAAMLREEADWFHYRSISASAPATWASTSSTTSSGGDPQPFFPAELLRSD